MEDVEAVADLAEVRKGGGHLRDRPAQGCGGHPHLIEQYGVAQSYTTDSETNAPTNGYSGDSIGEDMAGFPPDPRSNDRDHAALYVHLLWIESSKRRTCRYVIQESTNALSLPQYGYSTKI